MKYYIKIKNKQKVSIVVCARNEEKNISELLDAIITQDYDFSYIDVVVANDDSTDNTENILKEYCRNYPFIHYFNVENRQHVRSPKKNALRQAIPRSTGDIILLTDADCVPSKNWISSHIDVYSEYPDTDMVAGFSKTNIKVQRTALICQLYEHLDFLVLMYAAQGAIQAGTPFSCSGQNISYKKASFYAVNGFTGLEKYISGDDVLLMQKFVQNRKNIRFANHLDAGVQTKPINSWRELLNQRARWASNLKPMLTMNPRFFVYLLSCFMCIGLMPFMAFFLYIVNVFFESDYIINSTLLRELDGYTPVQRAYTSDAFWDLVFRMLIYFKLSYFWIWYLLSPFYILTVSVLGIFSFYRWEGRGSD